MLFDSNPLGRDTFMGIRVIQSNLVQPVPKIQISPLFPWCTPEFRARENAWWRERFGTVEVAYMFQYPLGHDLLALNPKQAAMLKNYR